MDSGKTARKEDYMDMIIRLESQSDVKEFVEITSSFPYVQELRAGRFVVDAKSILGIFSLDLSKRLTYSCDYDDEILTDALRKFEARI